MASETDDDVEMLKRLRASISDEPFPERKPEQVLSAPLQPRSPEFPVAEIEPAPETAPTPPDGGPVNVSWDVRAAPLPSGRKGFLARVVRRLLAPVIEAQTTFNSQQVQLDNQILAYIDARFEATHRHYDAVLGIHGRHMEDIDTRHIILQEELVAHVHDLVRRIDLALEDAERNRLSLEAALRELRARLSEIVRT